MSDKLNTIIQKAKILMDTPIPKRAHIVTETQVNNNIIQEKTERMLPKEILESIRRNPINTDNFLGDTTSVLEGVEIPHTITDSTPHVNRLTETTTSIDYSLIKMIVKEVVSDILDEKNKRLNENNLHSIKVSNDKIQLLTQNGDLFESQLIFKKNIKK